MPSVVLVLDVSASMLGKIGKRSKMKIAREVARDLVTGWDPRIPLGLTAYGHRTASCDDIEAVVPVSRVDAPSFLATVDIRCGRAVGRAAAASRESSACAPAA